MCGSSLRGSMDFRVTAQQDIFFSVDWTGWAGHERQCDLSRAEATALSRRLQLEAMHLLEGERRDYRNLAVPSTALDEIYS